MSTHTTARLLLVHNCIQRNTVSALNKSYSSTQIRSVSNISAALNDLPRVAGAGPFPSYPSFKSLGSIVAVSLPSSAPLYTREAAILAVNTESSSSSSSFSSSPSASTSPPLSTTSLSSSTNLSLISKAFPFVYTRFIAVEPATVLLTSAAAPESPAGGSPTQTVVIAPTSTFDWIVPNRASILAWSSASPGDPTGPFVSDKFASIRIKGISPNPESPVNPQVVLAARAADGPVLEMKLHQGETAYVHPNSLLAYTEPATSKKLSETYVIIPQKLPNVTDSSSSSTTTTTTTTTNNQSNTSLVQKFLNLPGPQNILAYFNSLKALTHKFLYKGDDILLKITGPKTILLASSGNSLASAYNPAAPVQTQLEKLLEKSQEDTIPQETPHKQETH
ncbi:uncharacterized protein SAPINGB_P001088 [Magnusiomyces paraingens]|uniref:Uncharacterized protein n=1 Tax=Magnusiomyces paraingens TaxID=2606893 RepID=A0A5E8B5S3_9ASCO|nr:uncharacterized protein SAPINGB_P001088 [Saprochaete ingens]VVT46185.1 unnamed protein product [Saprochaete ingens]